MPSVTVKNLDLDFGSVKVLKDMNIDIKEGEFVVLLGPSGCGKSTLLNCIAGLLDVSAGQIFIKERNVTWTPPAKRGIGMVFQSYALYPQMSVERNMSFGLRNAGYSKDEIKKRIANAAAMLQIEPLLARKPAALSGGQRQRVAIGRALVRDVDVFLFDEPLSNLDAKLRTDLRVEIKRLHRRLKNTMIYVTHDQVEAMTLADRIAVMRDGKIMQLDTPGEIYGNPVNRYVANFIGSPAMNFFDGVIENGRFEGLGESIKMDAYKFRKKPKNGQAVSLGIRPEHILVGDAVKKAHHVISAKADIVEPMGADTLVWAEMGGQSLRILIDGSFDIASGKTLKLGFNIDAASVFDAKSEDRL